MEFEKKVPDWSAAGTEPSESLKNNGFQGGYKPPAAVFNWFWHSVSECLKEIQGKMANANSIKPVRFVVGTSASGWKATDCDYLCDGTDDEDEINAAITALPSTGGEIVLLDGTYTIAGAVKLNKANVTLRGNGSSTKLVRNFYGSSAQPSAVYMTSTNCVVRDIAIDGARASQNSKSYGLGIKSTGENNTIESCYIYNHAGNAIHIVANHNFVVDNVIKANYNGLELKGSHNVIKGNIATDSDENGITLKDANYNTIIGNVFRTNSDNNIFFDDAGHNLVIGNNCAVLADDGVSPSVCIFLSNDGCEGNIVFDNLLGTGKLTDWGTNNDCGTAVPNTRKINNKALSGDITLNASDVGAAPAGYGLGSALPGKTVSDCDDAIQTGWYKVSASSANAPVTTEFLMRVEMSSVYSGVQTAYVDPSNNVVKMRGRTSGGNWSDWVDASPAHSHSKAVALSVHSSSWTGSETPFTATVACSIATASNNLVVGVGGTLTAEQQAAMAAAMIVCTGQANGTITLTAFGEVPTVDLPVNVLEVG